MKSPLYLNSKETVLRKSGNSLLIERNGKRFAVPVASVSYVVHYGKTALSQYVLDVLADQGIAVHRFSYGGKYLGTFFPPENCVGKSRMRQYAAYFDTAYRLHLAREIIRAAAQNKITLLQRYHARKKGVGLKEAIAKMREGLERLEGRHDIDELRGEEGHMAAIYFKGVQSVSIHLPMQGRSYHPPQDEMNALLSFCYALLYSEIAQKCYEHGMEVFCGFLHEQNDKAMPLVYDLSEMWKPQIDAFVLTLGNTKEITPEHFLRKEDGAVLLNTYGKAIVQKKWLALLREVDETKEQSFSDMLRTEVIRFRQVYEVKGEYEGWSW